MCIRDRLGAAKNVRNAMLFNILSFLSDKLLTEGNTVAALDELYIWLSNPTAIEYIRNCLKRVRKKESAMLLASQNLEDFDQEGIREMTKPPPIKNISYIPTVICASPGNNLTNV